MCFPGDAQKPGLQRSERTMLGRPRLSHALNGG